MVIEFRDGMEDTEESSYKTFSLYQVNNFEVIESERWNNE